jgi:Ala-tRNA(Pro) deacylase
MNGDSVLYALLDELKIPFDYYEHPPAPTVEIAAQYWKDIQAAHCKNLFFRNHKGNKHYLVIFYYLHELNVKDLEQRLKQGKLTFASEQRMQHYLGLTPGSVSPLGLIYDKDKHVHLFIDEKLKKYGRISFHPNLNTASIVLSFEDFIRFLDYCGNTYEFLKLYD